MAQQNRTEKKPSKGAASVPEAEGIVSPMRRFRALTKRLLSVNRDELRAEEDKYRAEKSKDK